MGCADTESNQCSEMGLAQETSGTVCINGLISLSV